jgi:hypothetical protein
MTLEYLEGPISVERAESCKVMMRYTYTYQTAAFETTLDLPLQQLSFNFQVHYVKENSC